MFIAMFLKGSKLGEYFHSPNPKWRLSFSPNNLFFPRLKHKEAIILWLCTLDLFTKHIYFVFFFDIYIYIYIYIYIIRLHIYLFIDQTGSLYFSLIYFYDI